MRRGHKAAFCTVHVHADGRRIGYVRRVATVELVPSQSARSDWYVRSVTDRVLPLREAVGILGQVRTIKHILSLDSTWLWTVPVREPFRGSVWTGEVEVFVVKHP